VIEAMNVRRRQIADGVQNFVLHRDASP
jgi:hypothetical protein